MTDVRGKFIWYELMTTDTAGAEAFYKTVVGWNAKDSGMGDGDYTLLTAGDSRVAGLMAMPEEARKAGAPPGWRGYVAVSDVDAAAAEVTKAGGHIHRPAADIPGIGRFAVAADPQGAVFTLFTGTGDPPPGPATPMTPGHVGWHELQAAEWRSAFDFYAGLFGWTRGEAIDMGAMGTYQIVERGGVAIGGMMTKPETVPAPFWLYYFNVGGIDGAVERVGAAGGKILFGPQQVPGGSWIVNGLDPQGVVFALVAPGR